MIDLRIPRTGQYHKIVIIRIVSFHLKQVSGHRSAQSTTSNSFVIESFEKLSTTTNGRESMGNIDLKNFMKLSNEFLGNIRKEWCLIHLSIHKISYSCNKIVIKLQIGSNRPLMLDLVKMVFWLCFFSFGHFFFLQLQKS